MVSFFFYTTIALFIFVCFCMILLILIQKGRGGGLASAFGGAGGNTAFGSKTGDVLTWATSIVFGVFILLAVALNKLADARNETSKQAQANAVVPASPSGDATPTEIPVQSQPAPATQGAATITTPAPTTPVATSPATLPAAAPVTGTPATVPTTAAAPKDDAAAAKPQAATAPSTAPAPAPTPASTPAPAAGAPQTGK